MPNYNSAEGLNGKLLKGTIVLSSGDTDYPYLIGKVTNIAKAGTDEHTSGNPGDDITVNFTEANYSVERIRDIERHFSELYGTKKTFAELPLDSVIMPPDSLIDIISLQPSVMDGLIKDTAKASAFANSPDKWPKRGNTYTLEKLQEKFAAQGEAGDSLIEDTIVGLKVYLETLTDTADIKQTRDMLEMLPSFHGLEDITIPTPDYLTDAQKLQTIRGLEFQAYEELIAGGLEFLRLVDDIKNLIEKIPNTWEVCRNRAAQAIVNIDAEVRKDAETDLISAKLFSPLNFYLRDRDTATSGGYDENDYWRDELSHSDAYGYFVDIEQYLVRDRERTYDSERGLAEYLHAELKDRVYSLVPGIELYGDKLWCVANLRITGQLGPQELAELKDWWTGQLSDGWGEGIEQRAIKVNHGDELYIEPWTSDGDFFVDTEREFAARLNPIAEREKTPMELLEDKLFAELVEYHARLLEKDKREIIGMAFETASMSDAHFSLTAELELSDAQITALLNAYSPLHDVAEVLRNSNSEAMMMLDSDTILEAAHIVTKPTPLVDPVIESTSGYTSVLAQIENAKEAKKLQIRIPKAKNKSNKKDHSEI